MKLQILHLDEGVHHFQGVIKAGTLRFYRSEVYPHDIAVEATLNKFDRNITCAVELRTKAHYICDRCLNEYERDYAWHFEVLFHLGLSDLQTDEDDVIMLSPEQREIDLDPFIEEQLILSVPMKTVCRDDCRGICPGCGADLNHESCTCSETSIDPRWEKLKILLDSSKS